MINVQDLMSLKTFKNLVLVTGESGLYRRVTWPNIAQTVSIHEWLVGGDVILMTGVGLDISDEFLIDIVHQAVEKKAACLIILINKDHIKEIPKGMIEFAKENDFPIFKAPWDTMLSNVIKEVSQLTANDKYEETLRNILWQKVMAGNSNIEDKYNKNILEKYRLNHPFTVIVIRNMDYETSNIDICTRLSSFAINESRFFFGKSFNITKDRDVILAVTEIYGEELYNKTVQLAELIRKEFGTINFKIGIGSHENSLEKLYDSFRKATTALKVKEDFIVTSYEDMGIYQLLLELPDQELIKKYVEENIGDLLKYDEDYKQELTLTLKVFLDNNGNLAHTAEELFIHRNTLLKRISRIEEILGLSLKDASARNRCYNCLKIYNYIKN